MVTDKVLVLRALLLLQQELVRDNKIKTKVLLLPLLLQLPPPRLHKVMEAEVDTDLVLVLQVLLLLEQELVQENKDEAMSSLPMPLL